MVKAQNFTLVFFKTSAYYGGRRGEIELQKSLNAGKRTFNASLTRKK